MTQTRSGAAPHTLQQPAVSVQGLTKSYGSRPVVDHIDLEIPTGVVAGFIGPNGAGKTTTMAMLLGLVHPSAGAGTVLGESLHDPASYLDRVGALIEGPAFWPGLTGVENLRTLAALSGQAAGRIPELLDLVGLGNRGNDRFGGYSLGMKQRLGIAAALLGDPELLVLDEPANGLDPVGMSEMRHLIATIAESDRTVLVSSHLLTELEQVCDWLVIIEAGSLIYQGPASEFFAEAAPVVRVAPEHPGDIERLSALARAEGLDIDREDGVLVVSVESAEPRQIAVALNKVAIQHDIVLAELHVRRPSLESHYLAVVEGAIR